MSTADIQKEALFDPRVVQNPARYAVQKGGVSISTAPFLAVSQTASQHTYNINAPSLQTFIDRALDWQSTCYIQFNVAVSTPQPAAGSNEPVFVLGRDGALCAFPLQSLLTTLTAQINDTTVSINTDTVLREVLRLTDYKANRKLRTCPTALDKYQNYNDAYLAVNNPLASYLDAVSNDEVPNGAYYDVQWTNPAGTPLSQVSGGTGSYVSGATTVNFNTGVPVRTEVGTAEPASYPLFLSFTSKEKLVLAPFIFADSHEYSTGLFSINNIQLVMNISSSGAARVLRSTTQAGRTVSGTALNSSVAFSNSLISVQFITPSLDLPLPTKSVVPYTDFPRFLTTFNAINIAAGGTQTVNSQTITLPSIPDLMVIYAKPDVYADSTQCDWYLPITNINLNFNNFSGLMNSFTPEQLYHLSVANGLDMDYNTWSGQSWSARTGRPVPTVGGFLVIKPGQDFALQTGEAPGLQGQITVQFQVRVKNQSAAQVNNLTLVLIAVQSGFFETLAGSSRIVKNVLSEADVINAPVASEQSVVSLARSIGAGAMASLGNALSKAMKGYTPPTKQVMGGAPMGGRAMGGAPMGGAPAIGGKKKSLSARLM